MNLLEGKKAIVTGGAQVLGAAISEHLAEEGCDVVIWDINREVADKTDRMGRLAREVEGAEGEGAPLA